MRFTTTFALVALLGATTACTDDDPVAGGTASASATITDDASSSSALQGDDGAALRALADGHFSGGLSSNAQVAISADGETWVDLGSPAPVTVALQSNGNETTVHSRAAIQPGTYTRVRLTLTEARADIDAGAMLGGISFTSAVSIAVGGADQSVVIEKQVAPFTVESDSHVLIRFDMNSEQWVDEETADDESVEDERVRESTVADQEEIE